MDDDILRSVPLFAGLTPESLEELWAGASWTAVRAGQYLFHQGDPSTSTFVVASGRLEVLINDPKPVLARVIGRGDVLGELGVLAGSPRSASVRAKRDSEVLEIRREDFVRLMKSSPDFAADLARTLGRALQASRGMVAEEGPVPTTIALIAIGPDVDASTVGEELGRALRSFGTAGVLRWAGDDEREEAALGRRLDEEEHRYDRVLLVAEARDPEPWQDFCLRQADRVLGLVKGPPDGHRALRAELVGCDLVNCAGRSIAGRWLDELDPRAIHTLTSGTDSIAVVARRLAGRSVGLVLSGGGARGAAHIGVFEELAAAGVLVDRVVGCSIGALGAAAFATGMTAKEMAEGWHRDMIATNPLNDYTIPVVSLIRGTKLLDGLRKQFGETLIEDLPREFFSVSSDIRAAELVVHRRGPLVDAVYASMCIPGLLPPARIGGRILVDGGVLNNLPVQTLAARREGPVIAVNLTLGSDRSAEATASTLGSAGDGGRSARGRSQPEATTSRPDRKRGLRSTVTAALTGVEGNVPRLPDTLMRVLLLGSVDATRAAREQADVVISPETRGIGLLDFRALDRAREAGRIATRAALASPEARRALLLE